VGFDYCKPDNCLGLPFTSLPPCQQIVVPHKKSGWEFNSRQENSVAVTGGSILLVTRRAERVQKNNMKETNEVINDKIKTLYFDHLRCVADSSSSNLIFTV
jgi:hypothetical protein